MWSYSIVRRSRIAARPLQANNTLARIEESSGSACIRSFSGRGGDGRGGGGSGRDGKGGKRGDGWSRNRNNRDKTNYSDQFLKPASRGQLKNHRSGIPKLTGRKGKGRGVRAGDALLESEEDQVMGYDNDGNMVMMEEDDGYPMGRQQQPKKAKPKTGTIDAGSKLEDLRPEDYREVTEFLKVYHTLEHLADDEKYYWNEIDYEDRENAKKHALFDKLQAEATRDADGNLVVEVDDETFAMFDDETDSNKSDKNRDKPKQKDQKFQFNSPPEFVMDALGVKGFEKPPNPKEYDVATPLVLQGPTMNDFVRSMAEHPTKYGQLRYVSPHPESTREPVPDLPVRRRNPPLEFVEAHTRFIYVWGMPPLLSVDEEPGDLDNPLHALELQKTAAALFDVPPESVYPASISSAFVGFSSRKDQRFALEFGPVQKVIESPVKASKYTPSEGDKKSFDASEMDRVVVLENLPSGLTPSVLASTLFPPGAGTDTADVLYGGLTADDFVMLTPHSAVLRFESAEHAENAVKSTIVGERLADFGKHRVRYSKARRELVYTGKHTGPAKTDLERELGPKLIVDGDMPTKKFYLSHATCLHLRNLDPSVTKREISSFFQPHCAMSRDVEGSIELVTCHEGLFTGRAYVGFDEHGEAEAALADEACASNGRITGLCSNTTTVVAKKVRDARSIARHNRPIRSEEDLLDSLDNWEQHVDPEDLSELLENGINKEALDEAFRAIRYQNPTFSSMDQAIRSETINPEHESGGMYRELVRTYIATLKECLSTPENPGEIYESLFLPDEELDTEIFEDEMARQEELRQRRKVP
mmetsp:Transcript_34072/g.80199  ORF Transcript_34072/g.80199 Transcript_34072/m.80199 type:complete len:815 (-) Transcript_34072:123-2567(-)